MGLLTKTHVPARSAGNVGPAHRPVEVVGEDGRRTYGLSRAALGGMWGRWFCASCNNNVARAWDEEFVRWAPGLFTALHDPARTGNRVAARIVGVAPGAFVRCLWAWMFALSDVLRDRQPAVAESVISGRPILPPANARLLLAATRDLQFGIFAMWNSIAVTAPPFAVLLLGERMFGHGNGMFDTGPWLRESAEERRGLELELPIVHTFDEDNFPPVGEPVLE